MRTLYLCYFGLREPLVQTQVLPYLRELARGGIAVNLLTFEPEWPWPAKGKEEWEARLSEEGIRWRALPYHKRPSLPATLFDIVAGAITAARLSRREKIDVLHARAHIALAMALLARCFVKCRIVFDIRGLMADEYVDAGVWRENSPVFRAIKALERYGARKADQLVVLTERMKTYLAEQKLAEAGKIEVIPCCADFSRFAEASGEMAVQENRFGVVYAGSVTGLYLLEEMGRFFLTLKARQPDAHWRILTSSNHESARARLERVGLRERDFEIISASPEEVPGYLRQAKVGLSFRKATFSQIAASPTKIPEYLAAGIPVISNAGIGDTDDILRSDGVGVIVENFDDANYQRAVVELERLLSDPQLCSRCRASARSRFDLASVGGERYGRVYERLRAQSARSYRIIPPLDFQKGP